MFFGWIVFLIIGVGFQVVPMFYVTRPYPRFCKKRGIVTIVLSLFAYSIFMLLDFLPFILLIFKIMIILLIIGFGAITITRLRKRRRALKEITIKYWYLSMSFLVTGITLWAVAYHIDSEKFVSISGIMLGFGFVISLINGMLYKIVPFLVWFHLTNSGVFAIPTAKEIIKDKEAKWQFYLHFATIVCLLVANFLDNGILYKMGGIFFIVSNALLLWHIYKASALYFLHSKATQNNQNS